MILKRRFGRARPSSAVLDELRYIRTHDTLRRPRPRSLARDKRHCHLAARTPLVIIVRGAAAPVVARRGVVSRFTSGINRGLLARAVKQAWRRSRSASRVFRVSRPRIVRRTRHDGTRRASDKISAVATPAGRSLSPCRARVRRRWPSESPCLVRVSSTPVSLRFVGARAPLSRGPTIATSDNRPPSGDVTSRCDVTRRVALIEKCAHTRVRVHTGPERTARARSPSALPSSCHHRRYVSISFSGPVGGAVRRSA